MAVGSLLPSASADGLKDLEQSLFLCGLQSLSSIVLKGVKTHRGTGKAGTIIYPSAEADGKRELAAQGAVLSVSSPINHRLLLIKKYCYVLKGEMYIKKFTKRKKRATFAALL